MDYLPSLYEQPTRSRAFEASLHAVALSQLANSQATYDLNAQASKMYSTALCETNLALDCKSEPVQDDTLAAILLLALYTVVSGHLSGASAVWSLHINGALTLMLERPPEALSGRISQLLLSHLMSALLLDCFRCRKRLPPQFKQLCSLSGLARDGFQLRFWALMADLLELQEIYGEVSSCSFVSQRLEELDEAVAALMKELPNHRQGAPSPFLDFHRYTDRRQVYGWNVLRLVRMNVLEMRIASMRQQSALGSLNPNRGSLHSLTELYRLTARDTVQSLPSFVDIDALASNEGNLMSWICGLIWPVSQAVRSGLLAEATVHEAQTVMFQLADRSRDRYIASMIHEGMVSDVGLDQ
jgi:hypothetical protein